MTTIIEATSDLVSMATCDGQITYMNQAGRHMLGLSEGEVAFAAQIRDFHPDWAYRLVTEEGLPQAIENGSWAGETALLGRDGREIPVSQVLMSHKGADGTLEYLSTIVRDLTERKQAEDALQMFQFCLDHAPDAVFWINRDGSYGYVNERACESLGYNREELLNLRLWDIDPDMSRERMLERWAAFRKDTIGSQHFESRHRRKDGKVFPVDVLTCHFWFGGKEFHVAFVRDITERKAAETALRESETRFRELAEMLPQTVFEIDATGRFTFANHAGLETFGYSREELTDLDARAFFAPADRNRITENIQKRLQDEPVINREYQALRKDGQTFPILLYASPIFRDGVPVGLRGIGLDISEQKRVEEERQARLVALESMERINGIIREATDPEQMIADVIQAVRTIFDCDRAWLLYPCDPDAPSFRVAVESTHPDYPGGHAHDLEIPITPPRAQRIRDALASQEPLSQIVDADHHDPAEAEVQFGMQSELTIAVFPKVGKPWTFGLHQCSYPRRWTSDERRLFKEISHRMADGLSSLMSLRHLRESETRFRELAEMLPQTVFEMDTNGHFTFTNHAALDTFGYSLAEFEGLAAQQLFAPEDRDRITENIQKRLRNEPVANREYQALRKDGQTFPILLYASPILRGDVPAGLRGIGLDITERKQAEEERQARLYALESMERINGIIREATDPEQMLRDVTEMVRSVFNCDRVWLLYPCDPDAPSFHVPVESTSPDCPGLGEVNTETPVTAGLVHSMRELLASAVPLPYVAGTERCVSPELADPFTIQSQLAIAVYPKVGKPWIFGLHQCSHPRLWTNEEQRLFKEISHRMADGLSSLLSLRNLKESETRFRELAELLPQTVLETDAEGRLSFANRLAYDLFGYRPDDLPALRLPDLFVADERPRLSESLRRQLKGEASWDHEFTAQRQDGSAFPVLLYSAPIVRDGVTVGLRGVVVDITERQHAEQALQESKAKLESIFESSPHAICVGDLEGIIVDCNQAMLDMHEFKTKDELLGRSVFNVVAESDLPWARKHLEKTLNEGRCKDIKVTLLKRDGQTFPSEASASLMRDATGQPMGLVATIADITERKRLEQALERRLVALTRPLSDTTGVEFEGLFDLGEIQTLQDLFADATGVASIITRPDGTPLTKPSNFCRLCATIIRQTPDGLKNCYYSDSVIGRHNPSGPVVQPCLSGGLWDAGASIAVGGKHIANWLIGQVRNQAQDEAKMRQYARHIGADVDTFMEAYHEVPTMSEEKFERIADALYAIAERLSTTAYQNVQQARFISERRRAQEELAHERNLLRTLIDNLPDSTYVKDRDSRFLLCSRQTILAAGVEGADQVIGKTDFDFYPSETATAFFQEEQRLMQSGQSLLNVERRFTDPVTHEVVWDLTTKVPLRDAGGQVVGLVGTSKDITALKQSQEALRESLQTSSDIVASIPSGLLLYKYSPPDKLTLIDGNPAATELLNLDVRQYLGWEFGDLWTHTEETGLKETYLDVMRTGQMWTSEEVSYADDRIAGVYTIRVFRIPGDRLCVAFENVTERARAKQRLEAYQHKLKSLALELSLAEERERRRIATGLHDYACQNLVLSTMKLQGLRASLPSGPISVLDSVSGTLKETLASIRELTFDLSSPILYKFGLAAALEELLRDKLRGEHRIRYQFTDDGRPKPMDQDVLVLLFQSMRELLINVIKHAHAQEVHLDIRREKDSIRIVLTDDGVGFDASEVLSFPSEKRSVGLFNIVERLDYIGGKLDVESEPGRGSRFTLVAPLTTETRVAKEFQNGSENSTR